MTYPMGKTMARTDKTMARMAASATTAWSGQDQRVANATDDAHMTVRQYLLNNVGARRLETNRQPCAASVSSACLGREGM